ncbi:hypothetical protein GCM10009555_088460 [Acrocarpospora macrocephala]|uniref:Uncharacterized protein n=1 Tax=Acrocarpospora macrocephala TaxID=150177 RepID=A0A5M3WZ49_9ACTN|nr:hypothetical protein Amac_076570 [Acrocarpospora macrocephala]
MTLPSQIRNYRDQPPALGKSQRRAPNRLTREATPPEQEDYTVPSGEPHHTGQPP